MPEEKATRSGGYEVWIATFVGVCALCVAGYTAYMQRQQVRAQVWPILEYDTNNGPIGFSIWNKGVGPAIFRHVIVKVDGQPMKTWLDVLEKISGLKREDLHFTESDMNNHVLSAGEELKIFTPFGPDGGPINFDRTNDLWKKLNESRLHVSVEICYSSTLGECWTLRASGLTPTMTVPCRNCPARSEISFEQ